MRSCYPLQIRVQIAENPSGCGPLAAAAVAASDVAEVRREDPVGEAAEEDGRADEVEEAPGAVEEDAERRGRPGAGQIRAVEPSGILLGK